MTTATATAWVGDRLYEAWREGGVSVRPVGGRRLTLEQRLDSVWEGLRADGAADCPVCHGRMEGSGPARCRDCGSELL